MTRSIVWLSRANADAKVGFYEPLTSTANAYAEGVRVKWDLSSPRYTILRFDAITGGGWVAANIMRATLVVDIDQRGDQLTVLPVTVDWQITHVWGTDVSLTDFDFLNPFHQMVDEDSSGPQFFDCTKHVIAAAAGTGVHYGFGFFCWAEDGGSAMDWYLKVEFSTVPFLTVTVKEGTFGTTDDTYFATDILTPQGAATTLSVVRGSGSTEAHRTLIKFTGWEASIPAGRTIRSATMRLLVQNTWSASNPFIVNELADGYGFIEATDTEASWIARVGLPGGSVYHPSSVRYLGRYGYDVDEAAGQTVMAQVAVLSWATADVVVSYRKFQCGEVTNNGHMIVSMYSGSTNNGVFSSSDEPVAASRPELVIEYSAE